MTETTTCPICDGTGWKIVERAGLSGAERCTCYDAKRAVREAAGIPPNYRLATLDNFEVRVQDNHTATTAMRQALSDVKGFVREFPVGPHPGLLLIGETGVGKTHLAVAALKALLDKGHEGIFYDYQNLLERIRDGFDPSSGAANREVYRSALDTQVLLLDDLGSHRTTEWVEDTITSIITYRCNHQKPLIATTNLPDHGLVGRDKDYARKTLGEIIGQRARSRLHEMCKVVEMPTVEDYRLKRAR
jgi:DNA replication protein DnaC